ncbi:thioredoxin-dependent thiol peroxidase [Planctomycetota bacterium]
MASLNVGDQAPDFSLLDQDGKHVALKNFAGKKLLVYFYPKADTPGCTKQSCSVRDASGELTLQGIAAVGISPDMPDKQKRFDDKYSLGFPLLSDSDHQVAEAYGAWGLKKNYGKEYEGIIRSSFLIDENGKIAQVAYKVKPLDSVPKALGAL